MNWLKSLYWRLVGLSGGRLVLSDRQDGYAQEGEDIVLSRLLGGDAKGFYVDVGAHHPVRYSNTFRFYRRGWRGLNIDARPGMKALFDAARPRDINVECAVGPRAGEAVFFRFEEEAVNTMDARLAATRQKQGFKLRDKLTLAVLPLSELLRRHLPAGQGIDFLSVDVEGLDFEVLKSCDWKRFRPKIVVAECIDVALEHAGSGRVGSLLKKAGYAPVAKTLYSVFFMRKGPH